MSLRRIAQDLYYGGLHNLQKSLHPNPQHIFDPQFERVLDVACGQSGPQPLRVWIERHGKSAGNVNFDDPEEAKRGKEKLEKYGDPGLPLTELGLQQVQVSAHYLTQKLNQEVLTLCGNDPELARAYKKHMPPILIAHSPYRRARHTAHEMYQSLRASGFEVAHKEILSLAEQTFGIWDGISEKEYAKIDPHAHHAWQILMNSDNKFYAQNAHGESAYGVTRRQRNDSLPTIFRAVLEHGYGNVIIPCHGTTGRALDMALTGGTAERWLTMDNPPNGGIILVEQVWPKDADWKTGRASKFKFQSRGLVFDPNESIAKEMFKKPALDARLPELLFG